MCNINNKPLGLFSGFSWVLVTIIILALGCGRFGGSPRGGIGDKIKNLTIPTIDPKVPIPALSADAFDALTADVPELARYRESVLAAERDAIKGALADLRSKSKAANRETGRALPEDAMFRMPGLPGPQADAENRSGIFDGPFYLTPVAMAAEPNLSHAQQMLIGHQIGYFFEDAHILQKSDVGSKTVALKDEKTGKVEATATLSIDTAGGPTTLEIATTISIPIVGLDAGSKVSVTGNACPNADGKVDLTVKLGSNARSGGAGSIFYDKNIEARIMTTVGDDANVVGSNFDLRQATHTTGGRMVDFNTSESQQITGSDYANPKSSGFKVNRGSEQVNAAEQQSSEDGLAAAYNLAIGALESAEDRWQNGGCVMIEANSPGTVQPSSTTAIPVTVRHKFDGSEVPSKLDAVLSGGKSVDPTTLARTSGTLTYTAPAETGKSATIALTATSRRGKATLDLAANTGGGSYQIVGGLDDWQTDTNVCDIMKPFTLTGNGFTMQLTGGLSGTYTYSGPFNAHGTGTYTISLPDGVGKPGTMTGGGGGQITGDKVYKGSGTEKYTLTPIEPCSK